MTKSKTIFLTGGTGFVGSAVIDALLARGYTVRAMVRDKPIEREGVESVRGDLLGDLRLDELMVGCDAVIHLVGIIREDPSKHITFDHVHREGSRRVVDAVFRTGIKRLIHMSALGVRADSASKYARTKAAAEKYLHCHSTSIDFTIFRPSMILGPGGEFTKMLESWSRGTAMPYFFMPFFGTGVFGLSAKKIQPVDVRDVAACFVDSLSMPETIGQTYALCGPQPMTWPQLYDIASEHFTGKPKLTVGLPIWYAKLLTYVAPAKWLPFNRSQLVMAGEDNVCGEDVLERVFGVKPHDAREAISGSGSSPGLGGG